MMSAIDPSLVVQTRGLTKKYGDVFAVHDLNLELHAGEVFGFLGPNGAGKTTTVKLLLGLIRPTGGEIFLFGEPAAGSWERLLRRVGAIVEAPAFYPYLSGRQNLHVLARLDGVPSAKADEAIEQVSLGGAADRNFSGYSVGMKQRLGIAAALLREPQLVLLDEPTSGLDPAGQREIRALIPRLAERGCTIFISSHLMHEIQEVCDRVGILKAGELQSVGPVAHLLRDGGVVEIRVADLERAARLLRALDWVDGVVQRNGLLEVTAPLEQSADLNRALAEAGMYAEEIRRREQSLEEYFLEVTGDEATP
jgi:ABC-2 type transport system ATP-binding protein